MDTREAGKKGGKARAKELSGEERRAIASLGGIAAREARQKKKQAKNKKLKEEKSPSLSNEEQQKRQ